MSSTPPPRPAAHPVVAAGAVVLRKAPPAGTDPRVLEVLLVHRPKYDDWSFPKGKVDRGEHVVTAAVREVAEETGLAVRLGQPLDSQEYVISGGRLKVVHYWVARVLDSDDVSAYVANREIDQVRWVPVDEARELLSYKYDRATLKQAVKRRKRTTTVIVLRHAHARARSHWRTDDRFRPLLKLGTMQADRLVPLLAAYDATRLVTSSSLRCVATVVPYADACGRKVVTEDRLSEEDATTRGVTDLVEELVDADKRTVLCTHRPVLPAVFDVLGLEDPRLEPGEMVVVHLRRGEAVAVERHGVR
ncbi:NUDIX hydrolase [Nocardioides cavernaquae]|uniref:NUDIX hydrolase n=1 Tax=Nocardioides cavernaquae TaxID=2321396 RepID=A0A3A5H7S0_9ACTN|nr:NUDIX hydrolase [Nocardioides cavernaquae]RJS45445.1 NUDIX hydrolase [Nocardioides cavernaquae]